MKFHRHRFFGVDHNMGVKPWASALRLISRNALASGSARLTIDAGFFLSLIALLLCPSSDGFAGDGDTMRVMTYNIHHGEGVDGKLDLERIANVIRKQDCDLVGLQEVDRNTQRSRGVDQMAELARLTGLQPFFGKANDYDGGEVGLGILSKLPVVVSKSIRLPSDSKRGPRIALEVFIRPTDRPAFVFVCTHLDPSDGENDRALQNAELRKLFGHGPSQAILAGDFNSTMEKPELASILTTWVDVDFEKVSPTISVAKPTRKTDYIFVQRNSPWAIESAMVLAEPTASDHLPLVATLTKKIVP
jgi:endonuclease/exonuclease/phosphatase family metal-dependent hydrolase